MGIDLELITYEPHTYFLYERVRKFSVSNGTGETIIEVWLKSLPLETTLPEGAQRLGVVQPSSVENHIQIRIKGGQKFYLSSKERQYE